MQTYIRMIFFAQNKADVANDQVVRSFMKSVKVKSTRNQRGRTRDKQQDRPPRVMKPTSTMSATQAARIFSNLVDRIHNSGETVVIERAGKPICQISPVKSPRFTGTDLLALLRSLPKPDPGFWDEVVEATRQEPTIPASPWEC